MTVWSLTTDTDAGLMTDLYLSEGLAYDGLIRRWFEDNTNVRMEALAALAKGVPEIGESAIYKWFEDYLWRTYSTDRFIISRHDHPWVFGEEEPAETATETLQAVRDYLTDHELTSDSFQEISDIIDGPRQPRSRRRDRT